MRHDSQVTQSDINNHIQEQKECPYQLADQPNDNIERAQLDHTDDYKQTAECDKEKHDVTK